MKLSLILAVKNGLPLIRETLESTRKLVDEIIIVDNGSTDGTIELAKKYTKHVILDKDKSDNFLSNLRNVALKKAHGEWVLCLDADEKLSGEAIKQVLILIKDASVEGYWLSRRTFISPQKSLNYGFFYPDYQLRLFRRRKQYKFVGGVHSRVNIPFDKTKEVTVDILHFQQEKRYSSFLFFRKFSRYIRIDAKEIKEKYHNPIILILLGLFRFISMFINGNIRGKGILDGWEGFRANTVFSAYVGAGYIYACWLIIANKHE